MAPSLTETQPTPTAPPLPSPTPSPVGASDGDSMNDLSAGQTKPLPKLTRPVTGPNGFAVPGAHPTPPIQQAAVPYVPPSPQPPLANPYQSQVVPPQYPHNAYGPPLATHNTGPQPMRAPQAPPAPGSAPRMGNTGTLPALAAAHRAHGAMTGMIGAGAPQAQPPHAQPMYPRQTGNQVARITVQYPQVGGTLKGQRGSYVVSGTIGSGEFGAVYECIGPFDQIYALKMVRPSNRPYREVQAEWAREQSRLFSLRHPNVVYIFDSFEHDHLFYLALERCDHALKDMLGTPMQEGLVLEMTRQLLAAVQFLHDNDVVHDDLHAGNVLITHTDRPTVKISDFGISNELRGMTAVRPNVVHHAIMAPEILATGYTSRQSDLYQVGLLLYWMLTGEPAIQMDVPYQELVRQVADGEPRRRAELLGSPFGDLIAKMLRRRETFRYASAREVWADLRELPAWKQRNLFPVK